MQRWAPSLLIDGYIMRSVDVSTRTIGDLPRILGMNSGTLKNCCGAIYGLKAVNPNILSTISLVGFNNDRDPKNPESFNQPPLMAGSGNKFQGPSEELAAEMHALYLNSAGMLIKFKFASTEEKGAGKPLALATRYPIGAGIREYVLHRPTPFQLIWTFSGKDLHRLIP